MVADSGVTGNATKRTGLIVAPAREMRETVTDAHRGFGPEPDDGRRGRMAFVSLTGVVGATVTGARHANLSESPLVLSSTFLGARPRPAHASIHPPVLRYSRTDASGHAKTECRRSGTRGDQVRAVDGHFIARVAMLERIATSGRPGASLKRRSGC